MIGIGVVGYGYWGPNLVRNFAEANGCEIVAVSDGRAERRALAKRRHPQIETVATYEELLANPRVDAIAIATPVHTHFEFAMAALRSGRHVWVEKPLTTTSEDAARLVAEADRRDLRLIVDHTFTYTSAVQTIHDLVHAGALGDIYYYDSVRVNLGLFQHDVNVVWDLAVHDLSIIDYVLPVKPRAVAATGVAHVGGEPENIAYLTLLFDTPVIAHVHVNWLAPVKVRRTLIGGSRKMVVYDDLESSEKVKVYDKGITVGNTTESVYEMLLGYRTGDMWAPQLDVTEALRIETQHFIDCIDQGQAPLTGGAAGERVVRILEAASLSLRERGRVVELEDNACLV